MMNLSPRALEFMGAKPQESRALPAHEKIFKNKSALELSTITPKKHKPKRLTPDQKEEIRRLEASGMKREDIARQFQIDRSTVTTICGKKTED
jgi:DNA invertase Pin-like site-specific DNA recombinase